MKFKSEKAAELWLIKFFRSHGAFVHKLNMLYTVGFPDLLVIYRGTVAFYELKRPGKQPTAIQWATLRKLDAAGAHAFAVTVESRERIFIQAPGALGHWVKPWSPLLWQEAWWTAPEPEKRSGGKVVHPCPP